MPILAVSYFARNIYEIETVISGLYYIEVLIFLENNAVRAWKFMDARSTDSSVELYNIPSSSRFLF